MGEAADGRRLRRRSLEYCQRGTVGRHSWPILVRLCWPAVTCRHGPELASRLRWLCYVYLNRGLFQLLLRRGGVTALIVGIMLHWIYHLYASAAYVVVKLRLFPPHKNR